MKRIASCSAAHIRMRTDTFLFVQIAKRKNQKRFYDDTLSKKRRLKWLEKKEKIYLKYAYTST